MAMTPIILAFIGLFALTMSVGMFLNVREDMRLVVTFLSSIAWGFTALGAWDVRIGANGPNPENISVLPLVLLGVGLSLTIGMLAIYRMVAFVGEDAGATDADGFLE